MNFSISYQPVSDLCRCIERMSDNKHVFFRLHAGMLRVYAKSTEFYADYVVKISEDDQAFGFGVDSKQFVAIVKKMDKRKDVSFSMDRARLQIHQGDIRAKLPMLDTIVDFANLSSLPRFSCAGFLDDLEFCSMSVKEDKRFKGVLVESSSSETRLAKLGFASCGATKQGQYSFGNVRFVVSSDAAAVLKRFDDEHMRNLVLSENVFGVEFASGVTLYSMLLADCHPETLFDMFGDPVGDSFLIKRRDLLASLEMIGAVMGDEMGLRFDHAGKSEAGYPIWKISCKTYKGAEVSETVTALGPCGFSESFGVHRKALLDVLKAFTVDDVVVYPEGRSFVYVTSGRYVALMSKMSL